MSNDTTASGGNTAQLIADYRLAVQCEWTRRKASIKTVELAAVAGAAAVSGAVLLAAGFGFLYILSLALSTVAGFVVCNTLMTRPTLSSPLYQWLIERFNLSDVSTSSRSLQSNDKRKESRTAYRLPPWAALRLSRRLNDALEEFFEALIDQYVNNWYKTYISADESFVLEVRHQIRYAAAVIATRLRDMDVVGMCLDELLPVIVLHVERVIRLMHCNERSEIGLLATYGDDLHWALRAGDGAESDYLRALADALVAHCVDATQIGGRAVDADLRFSAGQPRAAVSGNFRLWWPSHSCRHFLRELLLYTVLMPALDFISDPDILNRLVLSALADSESQPTHGSVDDEATAEFLGRLTDDISQRQAPDSLLSLKLNDLVREPRLIQLFDMYLRDIQGPTHMLDCFLQARDIHERLQVLEVELLPSSSVGFNEARARKRQMTLSEIESDAWQLFSSFIHESAPNRIDFSPAVRGDFDAAVAAKDASRLEHVTENVYKELYRRLHYDYVIPFCQSESYLGYLCGAPPDVEELIRPATRGDNTEDGDGERQGSAAGGGSRPQTPISVFSLTQFRNKLFSVLGGGSAGRGILLEGRNDAPAVGEPTEETDANEIALIDLSRDLSKWTIAVPSVVCRREDVSSNTYFMYTIEVSCHDLAAVDKQSDVCGTVERSPSASAVMDRTQSLPANFRADGALMARRATREAGNEAVNLLSPSCIGDREEVQIDFTLAEDEETGDDEILPTTWTIYRKYDEFFQLEEKIREFHGNSLRPAGLPDRKLFLSTRNRSLMEAHRPLLERFLQSLTQQPILRRSELLYDFLTLTEDEWGANIAALTAAGSNFMPDLRNPLRAMRRMPTKLARERGQNLKPFILGVLANILVPRGAVYSTTGKYATTKVAAETPPPRASSKSGTSSMSLAQGITSSPSSTVSGQGSQLSAMAEQDELVKRNEIDRSASVRMEIRGELSQIVENPTDGRSSLSDDEPTEFLTLEQYFRKTRFGGLLTFVVLRVFRLPRWLEVLTVAILRLFQPLVEPLTRRIARRLCAEHVLCEENLLGVIGALSRVIFDASRDPTHSTSDEERRLRADVTLHRLEQVIRQWLAAAAPRFLRALTPLSVGESADIREALRDVFAAFQLPRLNRQLAFVLVDRIASQFTADSDGRDIVDVSS